MDIYIYIERESLIIATLISAISVGHNVFLELTSILNMKINVATLFFNPY